MSGTAWRRVGPLVLRGAALGVGPAATCATVGAVMRAAERGPEAELLALIEDDLDAGVAPAEAFGRRGAPPAVAAAFAASADTLPVEAGASLALQARRAAGRSALFDALFLPAIALLGVVTTGGVVERLPLTAPDAPMAFATSVDGVVQVAWALLVGGVLALVLGRAPRLAARLPFADRVIGREQAAMVAERLAAQLDAGRSLPAALDAVGLPRAARAVADGVRLQDAIGRAWLGRWLAPPLRAAEGADAAEALREAAAVLLVDASAARTRALALVRGLGIVIAAVLVGAVALAVYGAPRGWPTAVLRTVF
ncbi:MAG: hypothetical protein H6704_14800 [Myxococcales bacterium]|nr:hypothetical protein [Myxococcales bacterium]